MWSPSVPSSVHAKRAPSGASRCVSWAACSGRIWSPTSSPAAPSSARAPRAANGSWRYSCWRMWWRLAPWLAEVLVFWRWSVWGWVCPEPKRLYNYINITYVGWTTLCSLFYCSCGHFRVPGRFLMFIPTHLNCLKIGSSSWSLTSIFPHFPI